MEHYYFKFMKGNAGINKVLDFKGLTSIDKLEGETFPISIYFGKWKADEKDIIVKQKTQSLNNQIDNFYNLTNSKQNSCLWIFYKSYILQLTVIGDKIYDGDKKFTYEDGSTPKSLNVKLVKLHHKIELPEVFSNINSNQKYNRKTITKIEGTEKELADAIYFKEQKIIIDSNNYLNYLTPTIFETLAFLIFSNDKVLCSSYRGGTLKDYDLRIKVFESFHGIEKNKKQQWVQVKYKEGYEPSDNENLIYITMNSGPKHIKNIYGRDWLHDRIKESRRIRSWLENMVFNYDIFDTNITWE